MNYITQINAFWVKYNKIINRKPYHIALYFALLQINNKCGWKQVFSVNFSLIIDITKLDKTTYYKACSWLLENGFLDYYQKGSNQYESAKFSIKVLSDLSESKKNTQRMQTESRQNIHKHNKQYKHNTTGEFNFSEILLFFETKGIDKKEAKRFFNYNESQGWRNITNWKPLAENWILNINQKTKTNYEAKKRKSKKGIKYNQEEQDYGARF